MFAYPKQAQVNRVVPKAKIYAHSKVSKRIRAVFVAQVDEILWKYKLSPETINLPARNGIQEIQVFEIVLKTPDMDQAVLQAIDKAIPFPLVFLLTYSEQVRFAASYRRPNEADASKWVIESLFITPFQPLSLILPPMPVALDLASLYERIVRSHISPPPRASEGIAEYVVRFNTLEAKQKTRQQLEKRLAQEKQFNRKVELNAELRLLSQEVDLLNQP